MLRDPDVDGAGSGRVMNTYHTVMQPSIMARDVPVEFYVMIDRTCPKADDYDAGHGLFPDDDLYVPPSCCRYALQQEWGRHPDPR